MRSLSDSEVKAFLLEGTRTAKLSVVRKDGSPFVTPVWFLLDDDGSVVFETERRSLKGHALARDPRVSLCVEDDRPPFGFVRLDGVAEISEGNPELLAWTTRIAARYMGPERAEEIGNLNAGEGHALIRVQVRRVVAQVELAPMPRAGSTMSV
jgi:PPOX class probable F420-dependent enzyme